MYIILDGRVDFVVDLKASPLLGKDLHTLASDLALDKGRLVRDIGIFREERGLDGTEVMEAIGQRMGNRVAEIMRAAAAKRRDPDGDAFSSGQGLN